jgi:hypothetical protein
MEQGSSLDGLVQGDVQQFGAPGQTPAELRSMADRAYRLAWLAGDEVAIERLKSYAAELEACARALK